MNKKQSIRNILIITSLMLAVCFIGGWGPTVISDFFLGSLTSLGICQANCNFIGPGSGEILLGIVFLLLASALSLYTHYQNQADAILDRHYYQVLRIMIGVLIALSFFMALNKGYAHDEYEHIHCAWYLKNNFVPYRDFFENHHPLLWYVLSPIVYLMKESVHILTVSRLFLFFIYLGNLRLTFQITRLLTNSVHKSLIALLFLSSMELFVSYAIEIRPDNLQLLFMLLSIYMLFKYFKHHKTLQISLSGCFLSISFLFLQKAVFSILGIAILLLWAKQRLKIPRQALLIFIISFLMPILLFVGYLASQHALNDYWISTWLFNRYHFKASTPQNAMYVAYSLNPYIVSKAETLINRNNFFWIFSLFSCLYLLSKRKFSYTTKIIPISALFLWLPIFLMRNPYAQYFIPAIPFFCITNGIALVNMFERWNIKSTLRLFLLAGMILTPIIVHTRLAVAPTTHIQREWLQFILNNTDKEDYIYDGDIRFNLFNPDVHYIWYYLSPYGWGKGLTMYNETTNGRFDDYDICALVRDKKPKIVSNHALNLNKCELNDQYLETCYKGIYLRRYP